MDILNNSSNCLTSGSKRGSSVGDVFNSKNGNFSTDGDNSSNSSSNSFNNSVSSTPNSLVSTPSPSSVDNSNSLSGSSSQNHLSQTSNATADSLSFLLRQYSLLSNNNNNNNSANYLNNNATHDPMQHFNSNPNNNNLIINGILQELSNTKSNRLNNSNGIIGKNQHNTNNTSSNSSSNSSPIASNRKKTTSNNGANYNSKTKENNSTIPPGLHKLLNKNSTMVNDQSVSSNRPKNLGTLMNNSKMRAANGDMGSTGGGNKFNDNIFSSLANVDLNNLQSQFQQAQQQSTFNSFGLTNADKFVPPFIRSDSFLASSHPSNSPWSLKSGQEQSSSAFDDFLGAGTTANPFVNNDAPISSSSQVNPAGEIGSGLANGNLGRGGGNSVDSLFSGLPFSKRGDSRDIWLHGNDSSSSFFASTSNGHTQDILTSATCAPNPAPASVPSLNVPSGLFDQHVWALNLDTNSDAATPWPESWPQSFANFNDANLEPNSTKVNGDDMELKKLLAAKTTNDKLTSLLDSTSTFDMKGRSQLNEIMAMFKKYILETTLTQDVHLCQTNFDIYFNMMKSDLSKFEASTFTMEELRLFQEIYTTLLQNREKFNEEKFMVEESFEQFTMLVKNLVLSTAAGSVFMYDDSLLRKIADKLANAFNVLYSAKYNNIFLNLVKFYKNMIYSVPSDILNNLPLIIEQSKLMASNSGNLSDPLFMAYRNFILELNKYNSNHNGNNCLHNQQEDETYSSEHQDVLCSIKNTGTNMLTENKDMNNNKKSDSHKDGNRISSENEFDIKSTTSKHLSLCNKLPPVFSHVTHLKNEPSIFMPFYYPVDHHMLSLHGPIATFSSRIRVKNQYCMSPNRQAFEVIVETELAKAMPGPVVLEKSDNLVSNKSFNKLVARLKKHFPNLPIKQLVELILQSKYAIMKKHKIQYGFSGFKIKDLVKYIVEYICDNAIPISNMSHDAMKGAAKGVSWSMVASASNQPNPQLMMSPSSSGAKDSASVVSSNASPSPSPSLASNPCTPQICALCKNTVYNSATDEKRKLALISCNHIFHKECIDFLTKIKLNPVCPLCDQFILRNEEFPSL